MHNVRGPSLLCARDQCARTSGRPLHIPCFAQARPESCVARRKEEVSNTGSAWGDKHFSVYYETLPTRKVTTHRGICGFQQSSA